MSRTVTRTDSSGTDLGQVDILQAHTGEGILHTAFSVFVFNPDRTKTLLQRRAESKMLFGGIWANTCCSHPFQDEQPEEAGMRRMQEELGISCELTTGPSFVYKAPDPQGKGLEWEYDTILVGTLDEDAIINPNPEEVMEWKWMGVEELMQNMKKEPEKYAPWLIKGLPLIDNR